jgi:DNA adenine methylase
MLNLSPMRFPGGKTKFLPVLREHLYPLIIKHNSFLDVFVGGGSVLLDIAQRFPEIKLFANDKDYWIYCFWKIVAGDDFNKLSELVSLLSVRPSLNLFYKLREQDTNDELQCAYKAIFFNRTTFSGIRNGGPIGGKNQNSKYTVDCRFNFNKLKKQILFCNKLLSGRTIIENKDFNDLSYLYENNIPAYLDPPYYKVGKKLYPIYMDHSEHLQLNKILLSRQNWVLSYDEDVIIKSLYKDCDINIINGNYCINGIKTNWIKKTELLILNKYTI